MRTDAIFCSALTHRRCAGRSQRWLAAFRAFGMAIRRALLTIACTYSAVSKRKSINFRYAFDSNRSIHVQSPSHINLIILHLHSAMSIVWICKRCTGLTFKHPAHRPAIAISIRQPYWRIACIYLVVGAIGTVHIIHKKKSTIRKSFIWIWGRGNGTHQMRSAQYRWAVAVIRHSFTTICCGFLAATMASWINISTTCTALIPKWIHGAVWQPKVLYHVRGDDKCAWSLASGYSSSVAPGKWLPPK